MVLSVTMARIVEIAVEYSDSLATHGAIQILID